MNGYLVHFAVYSFAMVGFILTLAFVYKKSTNISGISNKKNFLQIQNTLKLSPVKTIYVIKAGNEKFLIAGDTANTTMLAKLENNQDTEEIDENENVTEIKLFKSLKEGICKERIARKS